MKINASHKPSGLWMPKIESVEGGASGVMIMGMVVALVAIVGFSIDAFRTTLMVRQTGDAADALAAAAASMLRPTKTANGLSQTRTDRQSAWAYTDAKKAVLDLLREVKVSGVTVDPGIGFFQSSPTQPVSFIDSYNDSGNSHMGLRVDTASGPDISVRLQRGVRCLDGSVPRFVVVEGTVAAITTTGTMQEGGKAFLIAPKTQYCKVNAVKVDVSVQLRAAFIGLMGATPLKTITRTSFAMVRPNTATNTPQCTILGASEECSWDPTAGPSTTLPP